MQDERFVVALADVEEGPVGVDWPIPVDWLERALQGTEATPRGQAGRLSANLVKNGAEIIVRGRVRAPLTMPCARTLAPVDVDVDGEVFLVLSPASTPEGSRRRRRTRPATGRRRAVSDDERLTPEDAAGDTYSGDEIVLDSFLREFVLLELPMFPLHPEQAAAKPQPAAPDQEERVAVDPRLAPLAALKQRLEGKE